MKKRVIYLLGVTSITFLLAACSENTIEENPITQVVGDTISGEYHIPPVQTGPGVEGTAHNTPTQSTEQPVPTTEEESDKTTLTTYQKHILFEGGTEPPFDNAYWDFHGTGIYVDVVTGVPLFSSLDKFDSGTGRPSFTKPISKTAIASNKDTSLGMSRLEVISASSKGHLGHVFTDGPQEFGGLRYCMNSAALRFIPLEEMKAKGYEKYLALFNK